MQVLVTGEAGVIAISTDKILNDGQTIIHGTGEQTRDYLYVKDIIKANLMILREDISGVYSMLVP